MDVSHARLEGRKANVSRETFCMRLHVTYVGGREERRFMLENRQDPAKRGEENMCEPA